MAAGALVFVSDPGTLPDDADVVVALTPAAYEACLASGHRTPTVLDDHVERPPFWFDSAAYLRWQLGWLERLDAAFRHGDGTLRAAAQLIKTPVDSAIVAGSLLRSCVEKIRPSRVVHVGNHRPIEATPYHNGHLQFWPRLGDASLASRLLPRISAQAGLAFESVVAAAPESPTTTTSSVRSRIAQRLGPYRRWRPTMIGRDRGQPATLMLWYAGYGAAQFAQAERAADRRVIYATRGETTTSVVDLSGWPRPGRGVSTRPHPAECGLGPDLEPFLGEIDHWMGVPGGAQVVAARIEFALASICPVVSDISGYFEREMAKRGIDRTATANPSSIEEFGALLAARRRGLRTTLIQHGDHVHPYDFWLVQECQMCSELLTSDPTLASDLRAAAEQLGVESPDVVFRSPRTAGLLERLGTVRAPTSADAVWYVPTLLTGDTWVVGAGYFDDAWYHRWHLMLLEEMAARPEVQFVWKALPSGDQTPDPMPTAIARLGATNVRFEDRPFGSLLADARRVVVDFPSTAGYEAVHAGSSLLALSFTRFAVLRPSAAARFGPVLRECDTEQDALAEVRDYLGQPPERWVLPPERLTASGTPPPSNH